MSTSAPPPPASASPRRLTAWFEVPPIADFREPRWLARIPRPWATAGVLLALIAVSAFLRTRTIGQGFWYEEALATGIASHSLGALPGLLEHAGSAPFYYVVLHLWIDAFGSGAGATRALSLVIALASIPLAMWIGWSLDGPRAGLFAAVLFAFSSYLTRYAQETQPYALMVVLAMTATAGFIHGFVYRRRRYLWLFAVPLALMLYTQGSAVLFAFGAAVALVIVYRASEDRRGVLRDAAICFGAVLVAYLPWLPTMFHQISGDTFPWHFAPLQGATIPSQLLGSERVDVTLLVAVIVAVVPLAAPERRRTPEATAIWALIALPAGALVLARIGGFVAPLWAWRYFGPMVAPLLLLGALACARARVLGLVAVILCASFLANPSSFAPGHKSDMQDIGGELGPLMHRNDLVVVAQPEQVPLAWYYLGSGLEWASTTGRVSDPRYMNWTDAQARLEHRTPSGTLAPLIASLKPGQQLLYVRPLTEGVRYWSDSWSRLVRRRAAQWGRILTIDTANGTLKQVVTAPHYYPSSCCIADSAVLYVKNRT